MTRRGTGDAGSTTLETVILLPAMLLFIALMIFAGRLALAQQAVTAAAYDAARAASLERSAAQATSAGQTAAQVMLTSQNLACQEVSVTVSGWPASRRVGQDATITVELNCRVNLADLALPGIPGSVGFSATATSPIDRYRE